MTGESTCGEAQHHVEERLRDALILPLDCTFVCLAAIPDFFSAFLNSAQLGYVSVVVYVNLYIRDLFCCDLIPR